MAPEKARLSQDWIVVASPAICTQWVFKDNTKTALTHPSIHLKPVKLSEALLVWLRIGLLSFGGPAGQIALMHKVIVEEKQWLDEARFLHALNYCMLLPGPEAQQLATYIGWLINGVKGGLIAGILFILPGAIAILGLSWMYVSMGDLAAIQGVFFGLKAAVLAIVVQALISIARRALRDRLMLSLAICGFIALFFFALPFPFVVLCAGLIGYLSAHIQPNQSFPPSGAETNLATVERPGTKATAVICALLWMTTILALMMTLGPDNVFSQIGVFFSKMAVVTFGGAYAVLAYVAQQGVENFQWLQPGEMLEGLALAETTPGPLILVNQFVGFLAAHRNASADPSIVLASLGALLTIWVTFLPCFIWIFAGAPYIEKLRSHQALSSALASITAVVVGVIANLALWFAFNALFSQHLSVQYMAMDLSLPVVRSLDGPLFVLTVLSFILLFRLRLGIIALLSICAFVGASWHVAGHWL